MLKEKDLEELRAERHADYMAEEARKSRIRDAAPELLEALKALLNHDNMGAYERAEVRQKARAAIAKATGGQ